MSNHFTFQVCLYLYLGEEIYLKLSGLCSVVLNDIQPRSPCATSTLRRVFRSLLQSLLQNTPLILIISIYNSLY